jgi:hypothetical protein
VLYKPSLCPRALPVMALFRYKRDEREKENESMIDCRLWNLKLYRY